MLTYVLVCAIKTHIYLRSRTVDRGGSFSLSLFFCVYEAGLGRIVSGLKSPTRAHCSSTTTRNEMTLASPSTLLAADTRCRRLTRLMVVEESLCSLLDPSTYVFFPAQRGKKTRPIGAVWFFRRLEIPCLPLGLLAISEECIWSGEKKKRVNRLDRVNTTFKDDWRG